MSVSRLRRLQSKGRSVINLTLKEDTQFLDELVVVGYGMMKKSDMTGAISSVNGDDLAKIPQRIRQRLFRER